MILPPSLSGTFTYTQYRHGVCRWRRPPSENIRLQEKRSTIQGVINMEYICASRQGARCPPRPQNIAQRYQSKIDVR
jgi:hypothetical protein